MRKIKLLKDHEQNGVLYKAGTTVEVDVKTYDWLLTVYVAEREAQLADLNRINRFFEGDNDDL